MREILFRGKEIGIDRWVHGSLDIHKSGVVVIISDEIVTSIYARVDPDTIGQYTGLTDKNGKKIFEGDILAGDEYPYTCETAWNYFAEVVWLDDSKAFGLYTFKNPQSNVRGISHGITDYIEDFESSEWEVIGNIHDNPDMMGGE